MSNCLIRGWLGSSSVTHTNTQRHLHLLNTWVDDGWCMSLSSSHHLSPCSTICHSSVAEFTGRAVRFNEASARRREEKKKKKQLGKRFEGVYNKPCWDALWENVNILNALYESVSDECEKTKHWFKLHWHLFSWKRCEGVWLSMN